MNNSCILVALILVFLSLSFYYRTHDNRPIDDLKSPAGKTDYHTIGACFEVLRSNNRLDH